MYWIEFSDKDGNVDRKLVVFLELFNALTELDESHDKQILTITKE